MVEELELTGSQLTIEGAIDELYLCVMKLESYEKQTRYLMYRIPVYKPTPFFEIKISDLSEQVKKELYWLT